MEKNLSFENRLRERLYFPFSVRISHSIMGETVSLSDTGLSLALEDPLRSTRSVLIELFLPFSTPVLSAYAEVVWRKNEKKEGRFYYGFRFLRLTKQEQNIINEIFDGVRELDENFSKFTKDFRVYLSALKKEFDFFDSNHLTEVERVQYVESRKVEIFNNFNNHFDNIWNIAKHFDKNGYQIHKKYYQGMLGFLLVDLVEINRFVNKKPLGYAGDFMLINYHYDFHNCYLGESSFEKLINFYTTNIDIAKSVVARKDFFKNKILGLINSKLNCRILSVGSGGARELLEIIEEDGIKNKIYFDCLDFEKEAITFVNKKIANLDKSKKNNLNLNFIHSDLLDLLRDVRIEKLLKKYDFIYSSGLFDYLKDRISTKIVSNLFNHLHQEGELVITNADSSSMNKRIYYEMLGEWELIHRTKEEMLDWTKDIRDSANVGFIDLVPKNSFLFLSIKKLK